MTTVRDPCAIINYTVLSEASFVNCHAVDVLWTKPQEIPQTVPLTDIKIVADPHRFTLTMVGVATPDAKQSEAFAATSALFHVFSANTREEKVGLRLPPVWRDLWTELAEAKKSHLDAQDRTVVEGLRSLVRKRQVQELEDGYLLAGAFRGRGAAKTLQDPSDHGLQDRSRQINLNADLYKHIWADKSSTHKFQVMLVSQDNICRILYKHADPPKQSRMQLPMWHFRDHVLSAVDQNQVVIVCGETGW